MGASKGSFSDPLRPTAKAVDAIVESKIATIRQKALFISDSPFNFMLGLSALNIMSFYLNSLVHSKVVFSEPCANEKADNSLKLPASAFVCHTVPRSH
jgi:hypothetical protein